ncbi:MAG: hypothetical protein FWC71_10500 [Defluviitaleaceae bacterium]|nr:hypothetical protein [Defluviitaleaceae bacterium]
MHSFFSQPLLPAGPAQQSAAFYMRVPRKDTAVVLNVGADHGVAARFIEAVQMNPDDAWAFVSKIHAGGFDLHALRELFANFRNCQWVHKANDGHAPKLFITRSLYVCDPERDVRRLVHLRLVREPDKYGTWKVCAIEQEDCPRGV